MVPEWVEHPLYGLGDQCPQCSSSLPDCWQKHVDAFQAVGEAAFVAVEDSSRMGCPVALASNLHCVSSNKDMLAYSGA